MTPLQIVELAVIGLAAGCLAGLFGVGGGVLMVPAMVLLMGFDQHVAQGTSLLVIIPAALTGSITHYRSGRLALRDAVFLGLGGVAGALVGSVFALTVDDSVLRRLFALFLLVVGLRLTLGRLIGRRPPAAPAPLPELD